MRDAGRGNRMACAGHVTVDDVEERHRQRRGTQRHRGVVEPGVVSRRNRGNGRRERLRVDPLRRGVGRHQLGFRGLRDERDHERDAGTVRPLGEGTDESIQQAQACLPARAEWGAQEVGLVAVVQV